MWSIVHFKNDNSVYAVPSTWIKKDVCAWPKKNVKRQIETRIIPNKFDFDFLPARLLKGGIVSLEIAKQKLKHAENSSNLSSADEQEKSRTIHKRKKNGFVSNPPKFNSSKYLKGEDENKSSSEDNDDEFKDPLFLPSAENSKSNSNSQLCSKFDTVEINNMNKVSHLAVNNTEKKLITTQLQKSPDYTNNPQLSVKRKLVFAQDSINDIAKYFDNEEEVEYIQTSSSPFKVTKNYNTLTPEKILGMSASNRDNVSNANLNIAGKEKSEEICNSMHFQHDNSITPRQSSADLTNKVLRVVLKTKFDVEMILEKIDQLEHNLSTVYQTNNNKTDNYIEENDFWDILPIKNENQLNEIENKLLNKTFRSSLIIELKRHSRKQLTAIVRQMLRKTLEDNVLKDYSYVGQKKKKIFSSLALCSVIKEAVRKIKVFENVSNSDIEEPMKIYIAGATFRIKAKKTNESTDYNEAI